MADDGGTPGPHLPHDRVARPRTVTKVLEVAGRRDAPRQGMAFQGNRYTRQVGLDVTVFTAMGSSTLVALVCICHCSL